jgi:hypothetical protein
MAAQRRFAALLTAALSVPIPAGAAEHVQAGLWEITATTELPGVALALPPVSQTECLSQKDVEADPVPALDKGACRASDIKRSGGRVTWKLVCEGAQAGTGRGEIVYESPTSYRGWMTLDTGGTSVKVAIRARRIGAC